MAHRTSPIWKMSSEDFRNLVSKSKSYREVLKYWLLNHSGNYKTIQQRIREEKISTDHFLSKNPLNNTFSNKKDLETILVKNSSYNRTSLKKRLIKEKLIQNKCSICGMEPFWQGKPMILILDHINGTNDDCRLENLRLVCPNCNIQLPTQSGKQKRKINHYCKKCGKPRKWKKGTYCNKCASQINGDNHRRSEWPTKEELEKLVQQYPVTKIGYMYNVSGNAVHKWMKKMGIKKYKLQKQTGSISDS